MFRKLQKELGSQIRQFLEESSAALREELEVTQKEEINLFLARILNNSVIPALEKELSYAEHHMDIDDPFVRRKILELNAVVKKLKSLYVANSWHTRVNDDLTFEILFTEEVSILFQKIDSGTKYIPKIDFLSEFKNYVNGLLGVRAI